MPVPKETVEVLLAPLLTALCTGLMSFGLTCFLKSGLEFFRLRRELRETTPDYAAQAQEVIDNAQSAARAISQEAVEEIEEARQRVVNSKTIMCPSCKLEGLSFTSVKMVHIKTKKHMVVPFFGVVIHICHRCGHMFQKMDLLERPAHYGLAVKALRAMHNEPNELVLFGCLSAMAMHGFRDTWVWALEYILSNELLHGQVRYELEEIYNALCDGISYEYRCNNGVARFPLGDESEGLMSNRPQTQEEMDQEAIEQVTEALTELQQEGVIPSQPRISRAPNWAVQEDPNIMTTAPPRPDPITISLPPSPRRERWRQSTNITGRTMPITDPPIEIVTRDFERQELRINGVLFDEAPQAHREAFLRVINHPHPCPDCEALGVDNCRDVP